MRNDLVVLEDLDSPHSYSRIARQAPRTINSFLEDKNAWSQAVLPRLALMSQMKILFVRTFMQFG
jgi:hypothetical protein